MPPRSSRRELPPVMTWKKAFPVIAVAAAFDALGIMFEHFWLFGPAFAGVGTSLLAGGGVTGAAKGLVVTGLSFLGFGWLLATLGIMLSMVVPLIAGLTAWVMLMSMNRRIFKKPINTLRFGGGLLIMELPLPLIPIPAFSIALWLMYRTQIKEERAAFRKFEQEEAQLMQVERARALRAARARVAANAQPEPEEIDSEAPANDTREEAMPEIRDSVNVRRAANDQGSAQEFRRAA